MPRSINTTHDPNPPRQHRTPAGMPEYAPTPLDTFAHDLKSVEAKHTSFEHTLPFHRTAAQDLIEKGYAKLPAQADDAAVQSLASQAGLPVAAVAAVLDALRLSAGIAGGAE